MNIEKLRALLAAANQDIDQLVLFRNDHLPALLGRLEKLEAVAEAVRDYKQKWGHLDFKTGRALSKLEETV